MKPNPTQGLGAHRIPGCNLYVSFQLFNVSPGGQKATWKESCYDHDQSVVSMRRNWRDFQINMDCQLVLLNESGVAVSCLKYIDRTTPLLGELRAQGQTERAESFQC